MIRVAEFRGHLPLYAVDLASYHPGGPGDENRGFIRAVWFRHRGGWRHPGGGHNVACMGIVWGQLESPPVDVGDFLARHTDNTAGGDCHARWNGTDYWGAPQYHAMDPAAIVRNLALLRPMLEAYPAIPSGYDGWYGFR